MSAADECAEDLIARFGMPRSPELYRALLAYAFSSGQAHAAVGCGQALTEAFRKLDVAKVTS